MIDWQSYGPIYTVAPGIKKIGDLPIIEFDQEEQRYLDLKKKVKENVLYDPMFNNFHDQVICQKIQQILIKEYPSKSKSFENFNELGFVIQEDIAVFHRSNKLIALHVSFPSEWHPKEKIGLTFASIHQPVPGMRSFLKNESKYVSMMVEAKTPIIRYVWGEHYGYYLCKEEPLNSSIKIIHTERQTFIGIPEADIGLFFIKKKVIPYSDTSENFKLWYQKQLNSMTRDQKKYKLKKQHQSVKPQNNSNL